jgi:EAL domain-containing protein (putative c-di-GMP-specific phosphodiesterase class I)
MYWVSRVARAVDDNRLELYSQPVIATRADSPRLPPFHELLVRMRDDDGELTLPGEFIPAAERHNIVGAVDRWVVQQAIARLRQCLAAGREMPLLAVNLSGQSLSERDFLEFVMTLVKDPAIGRGLCFDIAESTVTSNMGPAVTFMEEVRKRGCRIALDDFGAGLSSFHVLKKIPVDFLKIDVQFVGCLSSDLVDRSLIEAISKVARALGITTIGERVESAETLACLTELGIDFVQGYQLARPAPLEELNFGA